MLAMAGIELQVLDPVVSPVSVDVVHPLGLSQRSTQVLLHHKTVLHDEPPLPCGPVDYPHIALSPEVLHITAPFSRGLLQSRNTAAV